MPAAALPVAGDRSSSLGADEDRAVEDEEERPRTGAGVLLEPLGWWKMMRGRCIVRGVPRKVRRRRWKID